MKHRIAILAASVVVLAATAIIYIKLAPRPAKVTTVSEVTLSPGLRLLVVTERHLAVIDADGTMRVSEMECVRVYAAAGTGICLHPDSPWAYSVTVLDSSLAVRKSQAIPGLPNRARVSASGRMVAWTTFVGGDSYTASGFSTRTGILDTVTGATVSTLEGFAITLEGKPYQAIDVNYWGVTFAADDNRFFATLATGGNRYLVEGDFAQRSVRTLRSNVECPSLSPDGTRIAFKQAVKGDPQQGWRLSVLELAQNRVTELAETRSIDDQAAWLDNTTIAYTVRDSAGNPSVWSTAADGSGAPKLVANNAESPATLANHL
jgi:hypothetical protein